MAGDCSSNVLELDRAEGRLLWRSRDTSRVLDTLAFPVTDCGCAVEAFALSPSQAWVVTSRSSGQGEWGYDVVQANPLERKAGISERSGYMLELPAFSADESCLLGGYGERWLGGWWAHPDDDFDEPARGGIVTFGHLFVHRLPSHEVSFHELRMQIPPGWQLKDPDAEAWLGARAIRPLGRGVQMTLPGGARFQLDERLPSVIELPTPDPT